MYGPRPPTAAVSQVRADQEQVGVHCNCIHHTTQQRSRGCRGRPGRLGSRAAMVLVCLALAIAALLGPPPLLALGKLHARVMLWRRGITLITPPTLTGFTSARAACWALRARRLSRSCPKIMIRLPMVAMSKRTSSRTAFMAVNSTVAPTTCRITCCVCSTVTQRTCRCDVMYLFAQVS